MWLYIPNLPSTSSASAPASEGSSSESSSLSTASANLVAGSATWRGKEQPLPAWSRRWKQGGFIRRLSGLTLEPSTAQHFADLWISSLRATRARETRLRESGSGNWTIGGCSIAPSTSSIKLGLLVSSVRTCRGTRTDSSPSPFQHWSDWAAALRSEYSRRPKPATPCGASDCSSWPSARTSDTNGAGEHGDGGLDLRTAASEWKAPVADDTGTRTKRYGQGGMALSMQVDQWEAPSVAVTDGSRMTRGGARSDELLLTGQAVETSQKWSSPKASDPEKAGPNMRGSKGDVPLPGQAANWPAPAARDHKGVNSADHLEVSTGSCHLDQLPNFVEHVFHLPSSPALATADGSTCSTASPNSNQPSAKRKLNPIFVEALMRWPTGLSGFERQETAWTRWWQLQRSFLSALDWGSSGEVQHDLFGRADRRRAPAELNGVKP